MATKDTLKVNSRSISGDELLSYIINVTPELQGQVELPVQGDKNNIPRIGEIISSNNRYKNAFINTVNLIALTVIDRNGWDNPWDFTTRGTMAWGDSVRELMMEVLLHLLQKRKKKRNINFHGYYMLENLGMRGSC